MLSDEEKKAIDKLKRSANYFVMPIYETKIILELIEKQSKEIEELNKSDESKEQSSMKYYNLYKELVDKIKAKIEEYKKQQKEEPDAYLCIEVLQSLLEKE